MTARSLFRFNQDHYRSLQRERWLLTQFDCKTRRLLNADGPDLIGDEILLSEGIDMILDQLGRLPSFEIALRRCREHAPLLRPIIGEEYLEEYRSFLDRCPRYMDYLAVIESQRQWLLWVASSHDGIG